jgi:hypothetical protein
MAIVHFAMKSEAKAASAAAKADYVMRLGKYADLGEAVLVESGNMPEFAAADPREFWRAADAHERANGRTYTELQIALPRELDDEQRIALVREVVTDVLGNRFAYSVAIHNPDARDGEEQPHFHLIFSERVVDDVTRQLPANRFFKRNGAKKDRSWNDKDKPERVRARWCELASGALERAGISQRLDPRSLEDQGRVVEALLVEPKVLLRGTKEEKSARLAEIEEIRAAKAVLAEMKIEAPTLEALEQVEKASEIRYAKIVADTRVWLAAEIAKLENLYTAAKEQAVTWWQKNGIKDPLDLFKSNPAMARHLGMTKATAPAISPTPAHRAWWQESTQWLYDDAIAERGAPSPSRSTKVKAKQKGKKEIER